MADFQSAAPSARPGPLRAKKISTRIDLTPMVDLGFLLITFFMLTTVLAKPNIMPVVMPDPKGDPMPLKASQALTLLLDDSDKVYWYAGLESASPDSTDFSDQGLRRIILEQKDRVRAQWGDKVMDDWQNPGHPRTISRLNVLIKASPSARYKNLVDAFDEMKICGIAHYSLIR